MHVCWCHTHWSPTPCNLFTLEMRPWGPKSCFYTGSVLQFVLALRSVGLSPAESPLASTQKNKTANRGMAQMLPKYELVCWEQFQWPDLSKWERLKITAVSGFVVTDRSNSETTWSNSCGVQVEFRPVFWSVAQSRRLGSSFWQSGCQVWRHRVKNQALLVARLF